MLYRLSFGYIKKLSENTAEVIVNNNVTFTLEMVEEYETFLQQHYANKLGVLVNKINRYTYTPEAQLCIGSLSNIAAFAIVHYHPFDTKQTNILAHVRSIDNLNMKTFDGYKLGRECALNWLKLELQNHH
ncbi:hypothetical protein Q4489_09855 [Thalassotalea sp. 1_MG-2023]|uniref:hypothetical protein n=1 Tax=Thalassotalea sp. 1_MG-2023 TaxID=3062680 RepID=UPI0026E3D927|nr:hypothetical protein [Thalassotalea sp. 1_MG-2023]MDO6427318.1 hypothetical protein [Thalassotalea sp. 1_MG-2023]